MIGMVLVTHGHLATEFRAALEHVVGPQKQIATVSIGPEDDMEERRKDILAAVNQVDRGIGVVVHLSRLGFGRAVCLQSAARLASVRPRAFALTVPMLIVPRSACHQQRRTPRTDGCRARR